MVLRLRYSKRGRVRFISHRDVARAWERAFRRARLPLAFTQGFSPHPKVSFGLALPLGWESDAEYLDVTFREPVAPDVTATTLTDVLPEGMAVEEVVEVPPSTPSVASVVAWADYLAFLDDLPDIDALAARPAWMASRLTKDGTASPPEDIRPLVAGLAADPDLGALRARLATRPRVVRPEEVCSLFGAAPRLVRRVAQLRDDLTVPTEWGNASPAAPLRGSPVAHHTRGETGPSSPWLVAAPAFAAPPSPVSESGARSGAAGVPSLSLVAGPAFAAPPQYPPETRDAEIPPSP